MLNFMNEKRINVGITAPIHGTAHIASKIKGLTLQDFVDSVVNSASEAVINKFKGEKTTRHARRDTTTITSK